MSSFLTGEGVGEMHVFVARGCIYASKKDSTIGGGKNITDDNIVNEFKDIVNEFNDYVPEICRKNRKNRDGEEYHITILDPSDKAHMFEQKSMYKKSDIQPPLSLLASLFMCGSIEDIKMKIQNHCLMTGMMSDSMIGEENKMITNHSITAEEFIAQFKGKFDNLEDAISESNFLLYPINLCVPLGLGRNVAGKNEECYYVIMSYPRAQMFRKFLGLGLKDFHITIGFGQSGDLHYVNKGVKTMVQPTKAMMMGSSLLPSSKEMMNLKGSAFKGSDDFLQLCQLLTSQKLSMKDDHFGMTNLILEQLDVIMEMTNTGNNGGDCDCCDYNSRSLIYHLTLSKIHGKDEKWDNLLESAENALQILCDMSTEARKKALQEGEKSPLVEAVNFKAYALLKLNRYEEGLLFLREQIDLEGTLQSENSIQNLLKVFEKKVEKKVEESMQKPTGKKPFQCPSPTPKPKQSTIQEQSSSSAKDPSPSAAADDDITIRAINKKYPRTMHLKNLGAATSDDLVGDKKEEAYFVKNGEIYIEEKIDGANIGFSLDPTDLSIMVQNRGHLVCSTTSLQFSQIDAWIAENETSLYEILSQNESQKKNNGSVVLYGEWCYLKHSIEYRKMPGYFVAFDIHDGTKFLSRKEFHYRMQHSGIPVVPILYKGEVTSMKQIMSLLDTEKSRFDQASVKSGIPSTTSTDPEFVTPIEGVMLRKDFDENTSKDSLNRGLQYRMKIVRGDFQQGIEEAGFWAKGKITKQTVDWDFRETWLKKCYTEAELFTPISKYDFATTSSTQNGESSNSPQNGSTPSPKRLDNGSTPSPKRLDSNFSSINVFNISSLNPRETIFVKNPHTGLEIKMMRNFSGILPEILVGSTPVIEEHIRILADVYDVGLIVTLTEEMSLPALWFDGTNHFIHQDEKGEKINNDMHNNMDEKMFTYYTIKKKFSEKYSYKCEGNLGTSGARFVRRTSEVVKTSMTEAVTKNPKSSNKIFNLFSPTPNYYPTNEAQTDGILHEIARTILEDGKRVFIHCGGGKGRAGTIAACCLLRWGKESVIDSHNEIVGDNGGECYNILDSGEVIRYLREKRPGSIETERQEKFIKEYSQSLWKKGYLYGGFPVVNKNAVVSAVASSEKATTVNSKKATNPVVIDEKQAVIIDEKHVEKKYPSTPYLPFSPSQPTGDDVYSSIVFNAEILITEKLDGGNCCIKNENGVVQVYARTHSHPAEHKSFDTIRAMLKTKMVEVHSKKNGKDCGKESTTFFKPIDQFLLENCPPNLEIYGENLTAMHSIDYTGYLGMNVGYFYIFAARVGSNDPTKPSRWLSWDDTLKLAKKLNLPTVPVKYKGPALTENELRRKMEGWAKEATGLAEYAGPNCKKVLPEGFVVRHVASTSDLSSNMAKFVRANHIQTKDDFKRTWKMHKLNPEDGRIVYNWEDLPQKQADTNVKDVVVANDANVKDVFVSDDAKKEESKKEGPKKSVDSGSKSVRQRIEFRPVTRPNEASSSIINQTKPGSTNLAKSSIDLVILCGLPGSGKSTFSKRLMKGSHNNSREVHILEQDELGKSSLTDQIGGLYKNVCKVGKGGKGLLIVDRCNVRKKDRKEILDLCFNPQKSNVLCVDFSRISADICKQRVRERLDHPTVRFGLGATVVDAFVKGGIEYPDEKEGMQVAVLHPVGQDRDSDYGNTSAQKESHHGHHYGNSDHYGNCDIEHQICQILRKYFGISKDPSSWHDSTALAQQILAPNNSDNGTTSFESSNEHNTIYSNSSIDNNSQYNSIFCLSSIESICKLATFVQEDIIQGFLRGVGGSCGANFRDLVSDVYWISPFLGKMASILDVQSPFPPSLIILYHSQRDLVPKIGRLSKGKFEITLILFYRVDEWQNLIEASLDSKKKSSDWINSDWISLIECFAQRIIPLHQLASDETRSITCNPNPILADPHTLDHFRTFARRFLWEIIREYCVNTISDREFDTILDREFDIDKEFWHCLIETLVQIHHSKKDSSSIDGLRCYLRHMFIG